MNVTPGTIYNRQTIALLEGELDLARARLQALDRPKEVVSRHRELTQQALRDEATLVTFQNQLYQFELEQARDTSPWELISTPTMRDKPVSPRHGRTLALGLLAGLVLGSGGSLLTIAAADVCLAPMSCAATCPACLSDCPAKATSGQSLAGMHQFSY